MHSLRMAKDWLTAELIPMHKKGRPGQLPKSYRPLALTPHASKLMERLAKRRMMWLLESSGKLSPEQAGYRACRSSEEQLALVSQFIVDGMEQGEYTLILAVDFTAAFDRARREPWGI